MSSDQNAGHRTLVHFGAGNIGRSFIGALFAQSGYEVIFVDVAEELVAEINARHEYRVVVKHPDGRDEELHIRGVRAVDGNDADAVAEALATASFASTAVGKGALEHLGRPIARGLKLRRQRSVAAPLDLILAENARDAAQILKKSTAQALSSELGSVPPWFDEDLGVVETSIGKMVPIMPAEIAASDPLLVYAEPYNTLIVDRSGFQGELPEITGLKAVNNIRAYVDRKLFVHNLGHAAVAYLAWQHDQQLHLIAAAMEFAPIAEATRAAMKQAAAALVREYPQDLDAAELDDHIEDLLYRFRNRSLGDTVYRVGRDLYRKLARDDRLVGAMLLCARHGLPFDAIAKPYVAALEFGAADETGALYVRDAQFHAERARAAGGRQLRSALTTVSGLDADRPADAAVIELLTSM